MYIESTWRSDLGNGMYRNPVINQGIPDPAVLRDGDTYYYCGSTGSYFPALAIYTSKDLVNWRFLCHPCPDFTGDVWAPDLVKHEGRYYLYFPADGTNYVSVSDHIDHGWSAPRDLRIGRIDPGHCAFDGKRYLFLSGNWVVPLSEDGLSVTGEPRCVCPPPALPDEWDIEGAYPESPKLVRHGGWYYLIYADGGTGGPATAHAVMCARAKNPIDGPWEFSPYNPMVHTWNREERWHCKGHGCMVDDVSGDWWILYHACERGYVNQGRKVLLEPVIFTEDGWPMIDGSGAAESPRRKPAGVAREIVDRLSDDFRAGLNPLWLMRGSTELSRAAAGGGELRFEAFPAHTPGESHPLTMLPGDHSYAVETTLEHPEPGCEAGVIILYDEKHFGALGWDGETATVYRLGRPLTMLKVTGNRLRFRMRNDRHYVAFYIAEDGAPLRKINYVQNVESMNATAYGGFASLRAGLFAMGGGIARFGPFVYEALS